MSKNASSYEIAKNLYLVQQPVGTGKPVKAAETPTNFVMVLDVSGSMSNDLPRIRTQLKAKIPKLLKEGDTLSMIWFSGRGQFGVLLEGEPVATLTDLSTVNQAVDRWLRPVGMTGFKEPLIEAADLVKRVSKKHNNPFALFFMSDGCDNQFPRGDILKVMEGVAGAYASTTIVEYGYYADRPLLSAMAEKSGGVYIHADAFDKYEVTFEQVLSKHVSGGKRIEVGIEGDAIGGFAYALGDGEITTYEASTGKVQVAEGVPAVWYLSPTRVGTATIDAATGNAAIYAAMSLYATRMKPEVVYPLLKSTGDVKFINDFATCFGKQRYSAFMDAAKAASFDVGQRLRDGYDPTRVPPDDAFTVLDLLSTLSSDPSGRVLLDHPNFTYSRISRSRVDANENLSTAEEDKLEEIQSKMKHEKSVKKLKELQAEIDVLLAAKKDALKFVADSAPDGYGISNLTYNEERPNISVLVKKTGTVDLTPRGKTVPTGVPLAFRSFIYRNYAIVKDGLVNVEKLPVAVSETTFQKLKSAGVQMETLFPPRDNTVFVEVNVKPLPILNRKMVKAVSAHDLITLEYTLTRCQAAQKVYKHYAKALFPSDKSEGFIAKYGDAASKWLSEQGLTDYSGFSPKQVVAESTDVYMGKEMKVKLKGLSSLPSVKEVEEKLSTGKKLMGGAALMCEVITTVQAFVKANPSLKDQETWLNSQAETSIALSCGLLRQSAQIKLSVVVAQTWFTEFASISENSMTVKMADGADITGTIELREIEIKI